VCGPEAHGLMLSRTGECRARLNNERFDCQPLEEGRALLGSIHATFHVKHRTARDVREAGRPTSDARANIDA
jgi:hypothetical protein